MDDEDPDEVPLTGWFLTQASLMEWHVVPWNDMKEHRSEDCWCDPRCEYEEDGNCMVIHNSADGREDYETGKRQLN